MASTIKKTILAASIALLTFKSHAGVIVDTGPSYSSSAAIYQKSENDFQMLAGKFELQSAYVVTDIFASLVYPSWSFPNAKLNISLYSDKSDEPDHSLFSGQITVENLSSNANWVGLSNIGLGLGAGSYWIVFSGIQGEPIEVGWSLYGATNPLSSYKLMNNLNGYPYKWLEVGGVYSPGLKILGTPLATVPEPENVAMLLAGLGLLGFAVRRNKPV